MTITREWQFTIRKGKPVGAVTYELVGDPTRGYAVSAESMMDAAE